MGTNYYIRKNFCEHCKRGDDVHIGKSSYGWRFLFRLYDIWDDGPKSVRETLDMLRVGKEKVYDEYGAEADPAELLERIESKQVLKNHSDLNGFAGEDGEYDYSRREFS